MVGFIFEAIVMALATNQFVHNWIMRVRASPIAPLFHDHRIFIRMTIREGALIAPPNQDKIIRDFLDSIYNTFQLVFSRNDSISVLSFEKLLKPFQNKNLSLIKSLKLTTRIGFYNSDEENPGWLEEVVPNKHYSLVMDMSRFVISEKTFDEFEANVTDVEWSEFYSVFIHEYKHFIQTWKAGGKNFNDTNKDYFDQPDEQQTNAEQYLELLKRKFQITDSSVIFDFLKRNGLNDSPSLWHLKTENPSAWKRIMKQAVLAAVRDANQKQ
jgi:hypothetical protein